MTAGTGVEQRALEGAEGDARHGEREGLIFSCVCVCVCAGVHAWSDAWK